MTDNLDIIKWLMQFSSEDDFYFLQIIQRKKENPDLKSDSRVIRNYFISNMDYLDNRYDEIRKLCDVFNARAMFRINRRSHKKVALKNLKIIADTIYEEKYHLANKSFLAACGQTNNEQKKKWIIDIDNGYDPLIPQKIITFINTECQPDNTDKYITTIPSKTGIHLITTPFNVQTFKQNSEFKGIDVHKDNPVNLYIP